MHLGFGSGTERFEDSFSAFEESLEKSRDSDLILLAGDVFDTKIPSTETLTKAMVLLTRPLIKENSIKISEGIDKNLDDVLPITDAGTPVVAIHGNHERRVKGTMNPVQALERAGFLVHLNANSIVLEKNGERVCVHGLSAVPDQYFETAVKQWNPKPVEGCINILMLHQLFSPITFSDLHVNNIPKGFDLYVSGDLHENKKVDYDGTHLLIPGSTVSTQVNKDAVNLRGFWRIETNGKNLETKFVELVNQRHVYYVEDGLGNTEDVEKKISEILSTSHEKKPVIRLNLKEEIRENEIRNKFENAIIIFKKEKEELNVKELHEQTLSVQESGMQTLRNNLTKAGLDSKVFEEIFELLLENKTAEAVSILLESFKLNTGHDPAA